MPNIFTDTTFSEVYKDDYRDSDNYYRVLFNSGRPVQARELTQLQTILSSEMERFGKNIFKDGAAVNPIQNVKVNNNYKYIKLEQTTVPGGVDLVGKTITGVTSGVEAKVLEVAQYVDANNPLTLYIEYTNTDTAFTEATDTSPVTFALTENIENVAEGVTLTIQGTADAIGAGTRADVGEGVFFVRGRFVYALAQSILLSRYTSDPSKELGFQVFEDIVTVDDTTDLYDNQGDVPNLSSPGADRYRIRLQLIAADDIEVGGQFAYVAKIINGQVLETNNGRKEYNLIMDVMAERTFEESGNYAVKPFLSLFEEDAADNSKLNLKVQPGIGYIKGYRVDPGSKTISVNKPTTTILLEDEDVAVSYGNYVLVSEPVGLFDVDSFQLVSLFDQTGGSAGGGAVVGTARVRSLESTTSGKYRLYLFDVKLNVGQKFADVASIGTGLTYADTNPDAAAPQLLEANKNSLFFALPNERPDWTADPSFDLVVQRVFTETAGVGGIVSLSTGTSDTFTDVSEWLIFEQNGALQNVPLGNIAGNGSSNVTISGLVEGTVYSVLTLVNSQNIAPRKKSRTTFTFSDSLDSDNTLLLRRADVISVVVTDDTLSKDVTADYFLDNGQRDNFYGIGTITLRPGRAVPASTVTVNVTYFSHSASGGYFAASSYNNNIPDFDYSDIPDYISTTGRTVPLREVLDFRSTQQYTGVGFEPSSNGGRVNYLPRNTATINSDLRYYLPRNDNLVITAQDELQYVEGIPNFNPEYPPVPDNAMLLYQIELGANTLGIDDLRLNYIDNRRYTMRDIGKLDRQIQENRELITLNALELDTKTLEVLDDQGLSRTKAGFFVDNFVDFRPGDVANTSFLCSIDTEEGILKPHFNQKELSLVYDSDASTNTVLKQNGVFLKYQHELLIDQPKVSGVINVNPFNVITNNGVMTLSPNKDNWRSTRIARQIAPAQWSNAGVSWVNQSLLSGLNSIDPNWRMWDWGWWGRNGLTNSRGIISANNGRNPDDFVRFLDAQNVDYRPGQPQAFVRKHGQLAVQVTGGRNGRTVNQVDIPFMRSREIAVKVEGLMPVTRHYPYFDEVDVLEWCKQLTESEYNDLVELNKSDTPPVFDTQGLTQRADGFTATGIKSDEKGEAYFSFIIPETDEKLFATGTLELAVYDITSPVAALAGSTAAAEYTARGIEEEITETSQTVRLRTYDPIAQSFRNPLTNGVFLTKVDIFVATKDDVRPLIVEIRPLVNGSPSSNERLRYGIATKAPADITTSADASVATTFEFNRPVFLEAETSYALVIRSESNQYFVYQATMGAFELNSAEKRITSQPHMGSLFASQNGETWEPSQDKDLMFKAYVADFTPSTLSGTVVMNNAQTRVQRLPSNPIVTTAGSTQVRIKHPYHGMNEGDTVVLSRWTTADSDEAAPTGFTPADIETGPTGAVITGVDLIGYSIDVLDSAASVSEETGNLVWQATQNHRFHMGRNAVNVFAPDEVNTVAYNRFTSVPSLMSGANGFTKDVTKTLTSLQNDFTFNTVKTIASDINETNGLGGNKSLDLEVDYTSFNKYVCPVINIDDASFMTTQNVIDFQIDSDGVSGTISPFDFVEETSALGGTSPSKYVTKDVGLANPATGLKIIVAANVPTTSSFDVYYKIGSESQKLDDNEWVLIEPETTNPNDDNPVTFREYRYIAGGLTGTLEEFNKFKVKLVMKSTSEAKYPSFKDLRVIALED